MSYNIDNWKNKKLENLFIPIKALYDNEERHVIGAPSVVDMEKNIVQISIGEGFVKGKLHSNGNLEVEDIKIYGEGSGHIMKTAILPALKQSIGILEARRVWESGDSIDEISVMNGTINIKNV